MTVHAAWDLPSLLAAADTDQPVIVLIKNGTGDAAHLLKVSLRLGRWTKVVVFDLSVGRESEIISAAESGAAGLHLHSESFEHLVNVIRTVSTGHAQCSPEVSAILLRRVYAFAGQSNPDAKTDMLTPREIDILELIVEGLTNQQISSRLGLSLATVKNHVHRLITKMGVASRAEAVTVYRANQYNSPI
jgi:DNA-binding NarL/FixJ family response regulator